MSQHQFRRSEKTCAEFDGATGAQATLEVEYREFPIRKVATIGRAPGGDIVLTDPSVSRNHARIFLEGGHYWLKDLQSANGTSLNGNKVTLQMLSDEDEITFGQAKAVFHVRGGASGPASIARDPLEGESTDTTDGTPTGGFIGDYGFAEDPRARQLESEVEDLRRLVASKDEEIATLSAKVISKTPIANLHQTLRMPEGRDEAETGGSVGASASHRDLAQENIRLMQLVRRLEKALADSNARIKILQGHLDSDRH